MKRVISLLLVLVVVLGCVGLAACGGGDGGAVPDNGGGEPANGNGDANGDGNGGGNGDGEDLGDILGHGTGIDSVSYTMETTGPGIPTVSMEVWVEGNKMRMEMEEQGQGQGQHIIYLSNYDTGKAYMYMPDLDMAYEMNISQVNPPDYEGVQDIPSYNPTIIGTDTVDGKVCLVVEYSYGGATVKSWIWKEHGFPIRMETTTSEGTIVVVFKNIDFGDINDNLFELPSGVQIMGS